MVVHAPPPRSASPPTTATAAATASSSLPPSSIVNNNNTAAGGPITTTAPTTTAGAAAAKTGFAPATAAASVTVPAFLAQYQIAPAAFLAQHRGAVHQLVAAAVVAWAPTNATANTTPSRGGERDDHDHHHYRVLVLQRSRHDYAGLAWEVPGGMCEAGDETILSAACRELWEEAGLQAVAVTDVVEDTHDWIDGGETWRKMTFLVEVSGAGVGEEQQPPVVKLDPNEHEDFAWVTEQQVREDRCDDGRPLEWTTAAQKATILDTFKLLRARAAAGRGGDVL